jgi:hypothetical protein
VPAFEIQKLGLPAHSFMAQTRETFMEKYFFECKAENAPQWKKSPLWTDTILTIPVDCYAQQILKSITVLK